MRLTVKPHQASFSLCPGRRAPSTPPSMRLTVKPHQASFSLCPGRRAPSTPPASCRSLTASPPLSAQHSFSAAALPSRERGESGGGERMLPHTRNHHRGTGHILRSAGVSRSRHERPDYRLSVWDRPRSQAPATVYAHWRPARHKQEPTHRTNGAFAGSPGGTTAALSDPSAPTPATAVAVLSDPHRIALVAHTSAPHLTSHHHRCRLLRMTPRRRIH